jgi:ribosomal RNA small subunit methyltransferase RsmB
MTGRKAGGSAREAALLALLAVEKGGAYGTAAVKKAVKENSLSAVDAALCQQLVFGVLQQKLYLDFLIGQFCSVKPKKMEDKILTILRLSVYQLLFLDRIPAHAVVNEAVGLSRRHGRNPKASALVNAVLRRIDSEQESLPQPEGLSVRYSHPQELVDLWTEELGAERAEALLAANNRIAPLYAQANLLYTILSELKVKLEDEGVVVEVENDCLTLMQTGNLERLQTFQDGLFYIQDAGARSIVSLTEAQPGMEVLDLCAAPGGKSFALAIDMENRGSVVACDLYPHKIALIEQGAKRLKLDCVKPCLSDARVFCADWADRFDVVLADVPCSGLGIIRKKPEIRYKALADSAGLPALQGEILAQAACYVKPDGVLVYATCTLRRAENETVVEEFLRSYPHFELERSEHRYPWEGNWDGFFAARLRKRNEM